MLFDVVAAGAAYSSSSSRSRLLSFVGTTTCTVTSWSPCAPPRTLGMPRPRTRYGEPLCVPGCRVSVQFAVERAHVDVAAERGLRERDRHVDQHVESVAVEHACGATLRYT